MAFKQINVKNYSKNNNDDIQEVRQMLQTIGDELKLKNVEVKVFDLIILYSSYTCCENDVWEKKRYKCIICKRFGCWRCRLECFNLCGKIFCQKCAIDKYGDCSKCNTFNCCEKSIKIDDNLICSNCYEVVEISSISESESEED